MLMFVVKNYVAQMTFFAAMQPLELIPPPFPLGEATQRNLLHHSSNFPHSERSQPLKIQVSATKFIKQRRSLLWIAEYVALTKDKQLISSSFCTRSKQWRHATGLLHQKVCGI
jgi:hypothetical protein